MTNQWQPSILIKELPNDFLEEQLKHYQALLESAQEKAHDAKLKQVTRDKFYCKSKLFAEFVAIIGEELHYRSITQ